MSNTIQAVKTYFSGAQFQATITQATQPHLGDLSVDLRTEHDYHNLFEPVLRQMLIATIPNSNARNIPVSSGQLAIYPSWRWVGTQARIPLRLLPNIKATELGLNQDLYLAAGCDPEHGDVVRIFWGLMNGDHFSQEHVLNQDSGANLTLGNVLGRLRTISDQIN